MTAMARYGVVALLVVFLAAPFHGWALFSVAGLPVGRPDLLAVALALLVAGATAASSGRFRLATVDLPAVALVGVATVSSLYAVVWTTTRSMPIATMLPQVAAIVGLLLAVPNLVTRQRYLLVVVRAWLLCAVGVSAFSGYQALARAFSLPFAVLVFNVPESGAVQRIGYTESFGTFFRVAGVFPEPSWLGVYLVPPAVFCLSLLAHEPAGTVFRTRRRLAVCGGALLGGVVLSASLLAYVTLVATLAVYVVPVGICRGRLRVPHLVGATAAVVPVALVSRSVREALGRVVRVVVEVTALVLTGDLRVAVGSAQQRLRIARRTVTAWGDGTPTQLLVGHGVNGLARSPTVDYTAASSTYLQMLYDTGLVGLVLFVAFVIGLWWLTHRRSNERTLSDRSRALGVAGAAAVVATGVQFLQIGYLFPVRWLGALIALCYLSATWSGGRSACA